ncbi:MAG: ChaN family lipoprotein [Planctomycetes bacterium]|nr:ChaN family lipoprotein [Planctomycetota bacterium]
MQTPRQELIEIEKRLVKELKQRIYRSQERKNPVLDRYYNDYVAEFSQGFERAASRAELADQLSRSHIAYFGDFHTLRSAQSAMLSLLRETHERRRPVVLALEMIHAAANPLAEALMNGEITGKEFRKRARWRRSWGFPWSSYRRLFEFAVAHKSPLFGLNIEPGPHKHDLAFRDQFAAQIIASLTQLYPNRLVAVLYGDLHLAQGHLPAEVDKLLAQFGAKRHSVRVYQNSETVYWKLVEQGLEQVVDIVKIKRDVYCVMNATPLVKFQSFSNWQDRTQELEFNSLEDVGRELPGEMMLLDQIVGYAKTICDFLGLPQQDTGAIELSTPADLDFLSRLEQRGVYSTREIAALKEYLATAETAYFPRVGVLYLAYLSVSHAAEGAMRVLLSLARPAGSGAVVDPRDEFYARILVEGLAFLGSKIINVKRKCRGLPEWTQVVARTGRSRKLSPPEKLDLDVARAVLRHHEFELHVLDTGTFGAAPKNIYGLPTPVHVALTRALGRWFGNQMFEAIMKGRLDKGLVRAAIVDNIRAPDVARNRYFAILEAIEKKPDDRSDDTDWHKKDGEEE